VRGIKTLLRRVRKDGGFETDPIGLPERGPDGAPPGRAILDSARPIGEVAAP